MTHDTEPAVTTNSQIGCCGSDLGEQRPVEATLLQALKALADPTRLRIVGLLAQQEAPLCVCDIVAAFPLEQPTISHHLRVLREAGLVTSQKHGLWAFYSMRREAIRQLTAGMEHIVS